MTQRKSPLKKPTYKEPVGPVITKKGISLFPRISYCIGNPDSYREFLKLLNMYVSEILDVDTLVKLAEKFIGKDERLFKDLKKILGWVPKTLDRPKLRPKPDLEFCEHVEDSPSYRIVPVKVSDHCKQRKRDAYYFSGQNKNVQQEMNLQERC